VSGVRANGARLAARRAAARAMQRGRRKVFDKPAQYAKTRREIEKHARYVGAADTDDLSRWLVAWCWFNPDSKDPVGAVMVSAAYAMRRKGFTDEEAKAIVREARYTRRHMTAEALAAWLGCTYADREALRLTRIGCIDVGPEARRVLTRRRKRLAKQAERRRKGVTPRAEYEAKSLSRTRPWLADGISRSAWERRRRKATEANAASVSPSSLSYSIGRDRPAARQESKSISRERLMSHMDLVLSRYAQEAVGRPRPRIVVESVGTACACGASRGFGVALIAD
jgi:hypothetical protein